MNVTRGLRRVLRLDPEGLATVCGDRRRSWRQVADRVARLPGALDALGAAPGERIAILALNSHRYLEAYLAVAWAGAVVVPLNIRWSLPENEDAPRDCRPKVLLFDKTFAPIAAALGRALPGLELVYADDGEPPGGAASYEDLARRSEPIPDAIDAAFATGSETPGAAATRAASAKRSCRSASAFPN